MTVHTSPVLDTGRFTYVDQLGAFTAEASDFRLDELGGTIILRSAKTGDLLEFTMVNEERDREHDIVAWHFETTDPSKRHLCRVILFND